MISVAEAISELLFVRDTVVVPGLGAFVKKAIPAKVNLADNQFAMPTCELGFDANLREDNDLIVIYMTENGGMPEGEARKQVALFVSDCFNRMKVGQKVMLKDVGTLYYDWAEDLVFEPDKSSNYNSDAFGLSDFAPQPVTRIKTKEEIKVEIRERQNEKDTPITVDEKAVRGDGDKKGATPPRRFGKRAVLLVALVSVIVGYGLHYFRIIDFGQWKKPERGVYHPKAYSLPSYAVDWDKVVEKALERQAKRLAMQGEIRIIAGCYGKSELAARLANSLRKNGYPDAFYELRDKQWYVSFGRYRTEEEAMAVLREIRTKTDYKAWILK